jgi:hypothetical protein
VQFVDQLDRANFELAAIVPEVELLRSAQVAEGATEKANVGLMVLAAGGAGLIALLAVTGFDARWARLRNRRHAMSGAARDVPVIEYSSATREPFASIEYVSRIVDLREPGEVMGIASAAGQSSTTIADGVASFIAGRGRSILSIGSRASCPTARHRIEMRQLALYPREPGQAAVAWMKDCLTHAQHVHLAVDLPSESVDVSQSLRQVLRALTGVADFIVVDCGPASDSAVSNPIARVCDLLVITAEPKATRQSDLRRALRTAEARDLPVAGVALGEPKASFAKVPASVLMQRA